MDYQGNAEKIIKEDALVKSGSDTEESIEMKQESEVKNSDADHAKSGTLEQSSTVEDKDKMAPENQALNEDNLHYEDGICIYTEPESKCQFVWDDVKKEWVARDSPGSFSDKDYEYDGKTYKYTDKETTRSDLEKMILSIFWDVDTNEWKELNKEKKAAKNVDEEQDSDDDEDNQDDAKNKSKEITKQDMSKGHYGYENDTHTYTDPSDGSKYFWDKEKNAWFPKVDDDFLAQYQMSYGFVDPTEDKPSEEQKPEPPPPPAADAVKRKAPQEPAWFDVGEESTKVYVSGLPMDITESEFVDVMQKCGLVMRDIDSGKMKVKIYLDPQTSLPKGDALCTYIKVAVLAGVDLRV
ncbi:uncharacterized protein LOC124372227 [Homalodisca vitripennis]|uniref:uncharacterized protein LOC124372227 n=1 Tax=Homalodisca vitripennis TaxID=197043 RepID=UPI001EEB9722|nr:uncharacterized protein LOC124372227 [Homalodisca vitripennis]